MAAGPAGSGPEEAVALLGHAPAGLAIGPEAGALAEGLRLAGRDGRL